VLHLVGFLLILNYDARNHELKKINSNFIVLLNKPTVSKIWDRCLCHFLQPLVALPRYVQSFSSSLYNNAVFAVTFLTYDLFHPSLHDNFPAAAELVHILCRNCPLKRTSEGNTEGKCKRGGRRKRLLDDFKEKRIYWNFKTEALDRTPWGTRFRREQRDL